MLVNRTFDEAMYLCFREEPEDFSMDFKAMERALKRANLDTICLEKSPSTFNHNALIECRHKTKGYWHYIVYDAEQKRFLDPIPSPPPIEEYEFFRIIETFNDPKDAHDL